MNEVSGMFLTQRWVKKTESLVEEKKTQIYRYVMNLRYISTELILLYVHYIRLHLSNLVLGHWHVFYV